jgi:hypothetical protein
VTVSGLELNALASGKPPNPTWSHCVAGSLLHEAPVIIVKSAVSPVDEPIVTDVESGSHYSMSVAGSVFSVSVTMTVPAIDPLLNSLS